MDVPHSSSFKPTHGPETVPFNQLCMFFEKMQKAKNNQIRIKEFQLFISRWKEIQVKTNSKSSFFSIFRLILPRLDKERPSYGVKETMLAKLYIEVLGLSHDGQDAKKLLKFRQVKQSTTSAGDFAEVAFHHVLLKRSINKGILTVADINEFLDKIASYNTNKKRDLVKKTLLQVIQRTSAVEQKWLIRILLKDMKLHLGQKVLLKEFHPDAESLYNVTTNLKTICEKLPDPSVRLAETEITLFHPFKPMLAALIKINEVEKHFNGQKFQVEIKYDGERSQIHKDVEQYKYFSRNGNEYSTVFGETCYQGTLSKHIHKSFADNVKTCILDGEMMAFDPTLNIFMQKGGKFDIKHVTEDSDFQPCFVAYDLLSLNGEHTTSKTQSERFQMLESIITPVEGRILIAEKRQASTNQQVLQFLNEAIDRREEGIVIKDMTSVYSPNKRKDSGWFKVKPEYVGGVVDDLDLVIIGGSFGKGRRANFLSMFHLAVGVRDPGNPSKPPEVFKSLCRVGSGYTDKELAQIIEKLKPNLKVFEKRRVPSWLEVSKEKPEVVIHPQHSLVVQVRASEIIPSASYATNCTLRFPRIVALREDKSYPDALDYEQLKELRETADGKLASSHAKLPTESPAPKRRKTAPVIPPAIHAKFQGVEASEVKKKSSAFEKKVFCLMSGYKEYTKQDLEKRVLENGGKVVQNPTDDLFCAVTKDARGLKVRNIIKSQKYDVVLVDWLLRCFDAGALLPWKPTDLVFTTTQTRQKLNDIFDKFGDDFTQELSEDSLKDIFSRISSDQLSSVLPPSQDQNFTSARQAFVNASCERLSSFGLDCRPSTLFQGLHFHIPCCKTSEMVQARLTELRSLVSFYCGILCDAIEADVISHVIIDDDLVDEVTRRRVVERSHQGQRRYRLIRSAWVQDCAREKNLLPEVSYQV